MPFPFAATTAPPPPSVPDLPQRPEPTVAFVFWPREEDHRRRLAARGEPRLLLLAEDAPAPESSDPLEGWIREPFDAADLDARVHQVHGRARCAERAERRPHVDADGVRRASGGRRMSARSALRTRQEPFGKSWHCRHEEETGLPDPLPSPVHTHERRSTRWNPATQPGC